MGLIILPLMVIWGLACIYSIRTGYHLISGHPFLSFGLPLILITLSCIAIYVYLGLAGFKNQKELWAFEIPFYFMTGKTVIALFMLAGLSHFFYAHQINNMYLLAGLIIVMMTVSAGALIGALSSDYFIQTHNIKITY